MPKKPAPSGCPLDEARAAKPAAVSAFQRLAEVAGVGITRVGEGYGLKVNLRGKPKSTVILPEEIQGVPVRVEVVGAIKKRLAA